MIRVAITIFLLLLWVPRLHAEGDEANPHLMLDSEGEPDLDKCGFCHDDDLTLLQTKEDTCLACHSATEHAGASEHLRIKPDALAQMLPEWSKDETLDFTDAGGIYCGTCHLFHDPKDDSNPWLEDQPRPRTALSAAVRGELETYRDSLTTGDAAHFAEKGTRALRMESRDGALCTHCHGHDRSKTLPATAPNRPDGGTP